MILRCQPFCENNFRPAAPGGGGGGRPRIDSGDDEQPENSRVGKKNAVFTGFALQSGKTIRARRFESDSADGVGKRPGGAKNDISAKPKKMPESMPISPNCADFFRARIPEMKKSAALPAADF